MKKTAEDKILMFLKMKGESSALHIAEELEITKEGARQHLGRMTKDGLLEMYSKSEGVGRPIAYFSLSEAGLAKFPDSHAQITVDILRSVKKLLGNNALDLLINDRESKVYENYEIKMRKASTLEQRLEMLTKIRSEEGYMAEWKEENGEYFLIENHCPICAAVTECQGFCRSELKNFRHLIGEEFEVERMQHIVSGGSRCVYRITEKVPV